MELQHILNAIFAVSVITGIAIIRKLFTENDQLRRRMFDLENRPEPVDRQPKQMSKVKPLPEKYRI